MTKKPEKKEAVRIGEVICRLREKKGLTAAEVAARCNVTKSAYYQWEKAPRILEKNLPALARVLGVSIDYLNKINGDAVRRTSEADETSVAAQ